MTDCEFFISKLISMIHQLFESMVESKTTVLKDQTEDKI